MVTLVLGGYPTVSKVSNRRAPSTSTAARVDGAARLWVDCGVRCEGNGMKEEGEIDADLLQENKKIRQPGKNFSLPRHPNRPKVIGNPWVTPHQK
jgi:hypothetical protein